MRKYTVSDDAELPVGGHKFLIEKGDSIMAETAIGFPKLDEEEDESQEEDRDEELEGNEEKYEVTEDVEIMLNGDKYIIEKGYTIFVENKNGWPEDVKEGGLRNRMGLDEDKPLDEQTTPEEVANFFDQADEDGRGKVMYAVNSNKNDNEFWAEVADLIEPKNDNSE